jgi:hypothetical protein
VPQLSAGKQGLIDFIIGVVILLTGVPVLIVVWEVISTGRLPHPSITGLVLLVVLILAITLAKNRTKILITLGAFIALRLVVALFFWAVTKMV